VGQSAPRTLTLFPTSDTLNFPDRLLLLIYGTLSPALNRGKSGSTDFGRKRWKLVDDYGSYLAWCGYMQRPDIEYMEDQPIKINVDIKVAKGRATFTVVDSPTSV
jgi:hypothetical protein